MASSAPRLRVAALAWLLTLAIAPAAHALEPSASAKATARALMDEGNERRDRGDLRGALEAFRAADALVHVPTTGLEVARVEAALGLLVEAREHVEVVAAAPPAPNEPRELAEARAAAAEMSDELDARMASVRVTIEGEGRDAATLSIDGESVPRAARAVAHRLDPGVHVLVARTAAGREARVSVTLREREARSVPIALPEAPPPPAVVSVVPRPRPPAAPDRTLAFASLGVAGAGALVGIVSGLVALSHREAAASQCAGSVCPPSTFHDLDTASAASTVSDVGFAVGGVALAVGLVDLLATRSSKPTARGPGVWVGAGSAGVRGTF